jgi:class 3 adenylate cyclase
MDLRALDDRGLARPPAALAAWLAAAGEADLYRVNVAALSRRLGAPRRAFVDWFLASVEAGAFSLAWDYHCPHCRGIPGSGAHFAELREEGYCPGCRLGFHNVLDETVEVTFTVHPSIMPIPDMIKEELKAAMIGAAAAKTLKMPAEFLSGLECITSPAFGRIFGEDVLLAEESLEVSRVAFLFTDIRGSTSLYSRLGDPAGYRVVREHFALLFREVEAAGGSVVKTIGDAVMAAFNSSADAARAAISAYGAFKDREWGEAGVLEIKMGLHAGKAIVVTLNDRLDYFGTTVNTAARIEALAESHTVCFSRAVASDPGARAAVARWISDSGGRVLRNAARLKGIEGPVEVFRLDEG